MPDKIYFRKKILRDKEDHFIMKRSIYREDITLKVYVPNRWALKYTKQKLMEQQGKIDKFVVVVGPFSPLSIIIRTRK